MKATAKSWKIEPFGTVQPITFTAEYSIAEYERIQCGFVPSVMEEKWFIYFDEPFLFLHRSWTGQAAYQIELEPDENGARVVGAARSGDFLSDGDEAYDSAFLEFLIATFLLGRNAPFPLPEGENANSGVYQHVMAGTGASEFVVRKPRPWWKFW